MSARRESWRASAFLVSCGWRAAPGWMTAEGVDVVVRGITSTLMAYTVKIFVRAVETHSVGTFVGGVVLLAVSTAVNSLSTYLMATLGQVLTQRTDLYLTVKIAELVNKVPGVEHFERPEYLRELDLLTLRRRQLAVAPREVAQLLFVLARTVVMLVLLARVNLLFLLLPVITAAPVLANAWGTRARQRADVAIAPDLRRANHLFELASTAAPAKELRVFGLAPELEARHESLVRSILVRNDRSALAALGVELGGWLVLGGAFAAFMAIVVISAAHGHIDTADLVMTILLVQQIQSQLSGATRSTGSLQQAKQAAERYVWLERFADDATAGRRETDVPARLSDGIALDHVTFCYPGTEARVLDDVSFRMPAGSTVAIVGENGAGKTTLAKLLAGMYRPTSGEIQIDGVDLATYDTEAWRKNISATFQDFVNFQLRAGDTVGIGELARLGDDEAAVTALGRSGGSSLVAELDAGLDTLLGKSNPDGRELSGGQWQKLALGRGRMRDRPVLLLLDEPTASLDATTEHALFDYYVRAARESADDAGAITVIISHRFSTVRMADFVVVLNDNTVAEIGTHDELMAAGKLYAELFSLQERGYRA